MSVTYSTIGEITIGQNLIADGKTYKYIRNSVHPDLGGVKVFQNEQGENRLFQKSKDSQRVLVRSLNTFEL
jgi:hypothetical protein